jgi:hypothetical protein
MSHSLTTFFIYATVFRADNSMPETVLLEDDEESVQNSLAGAMGDEGYEVVTLRRRGGFAIKSRWRSLNEISTEPGSF